MGFTRGDGVCFKGAALVIMGSLFQNLALVMGLPSGLSQAHVYQIPYTSYPPRGFIANKTLNLYSFAISASLI